MEATISIGFFQRAIIYYITSKGVVLETPDGISQFMYQFAGLIFNNVSPEYTGKFNKPLEEWKKDNRQTIYFMEKELFLKELKQECLGGDQMKLFGIFMGLLENAETVIIDQCGTLVIG